MTQPCYLLSIDLLWKKGMWVNNLNGRTGISNIDSADMDRTQWVEFRKNCENAFSFIWICIFTRFFLFLILSNFLGVTKVFWHVLASFSKTCWKMFHMMKMPQLFSLTCPMTNWNYWSPLCTPALSLLLPLQNLKDLTPSYINLASMSTQLKVLYY